MTLRTWCLVLALTLVSPMSVALTALEAPKTIRVALDSSYAPYSFQSDDGKLQGILVDQWQAWQKRTGITVELHATDWDEALRRIRGGEYDVIDSIVETAERRGLFDFTPPYATVEASIFFRSNLTGIADLASLKGVPVGVKAGDQHIDRLREIGVTTLVLFPNNRSLIEAARQHRINVFLVDAPSALYLLNKMGIDAEFRHSAPVFQDQLRRAVRKGEANVLRTVSDGFAAIDPRELKQIDEKWFGRTINRYQGYLTYAAYAAVVALLLVAALLGWNRALRTRILQRTAAWSESEQRFSQIAENMREVFWMTTPDWATMLYVSPAYESIWGRSLDSLRERPRSFMEAIHADDRERVIGMLERQREQGFEVEYRIVRPDGSTRWIRDRGFPVRDESGKVCRVAGVAEDITERKRAEEQALQIAQQMQALSEQREAHLRLVIDSIPTMAWSLLADGAIDFVNQRWRDYTGLSVDQALSDPAGIVHPEDLPWVMEKWVIDKAAAAPSAYEMRLRRADGEYRWFLVRTVPLRDERGNVVKWYGTSTDIEDRKRVEDVLRQREFDLAEAQRVARIGSWSIDLTSDRVRWSEELYRIFDMERDFLGTYDAFFSRVHPDDQRAVLRASANARSSGTPFEVDYRVKTRSGKLKHIRETGYAKRDAAGVVAELFGTAQDITERKRAEDALRDSGAQLQALSRRLVDLQESEGKALARELHDRVGQNLTALNINLRILATLLPTQVSDELRARLADSEALIESTAAAIGNLAAELRPPMLDDHGLVLALEWYARLLSARTGLSVAVRGPEPVERPAPEIEIALFRIAQEALNNVLKHARATRVDITLGRSGTEYVMSVEDDGVGFADEERDAHEGFGMITMRERSQAVGGRLEVLAIPGDGTRLTVRVPS